MENENIQRQNEENKEVTNQNTEQQNEKDAENKNKDFSVETNEEYYAKMDGMLAKRVDGIVKSILKSNGAEDDEVKEFLNGYRSRNKEKETKIGEQIEALTKENEALKKSIFEGKFKTAVDGLADKIGFDKKYTNQIIKLANLEGVNENNEVNAEKLENAIKAVIDDCEAFKIQHKEEQKNTGFKNIGANGPEEKPEDLTAKIRKAAGLKN